MMDKKKPVYKQFASDNRKNMPQGERHLWYDCLKPCEFKFVRQKRVDNYIVDFYCHQARLAIEVDGKQHYTEEARLYDAQRTMELERHGIMVLRYTNQQIFQYFDAIKGEIERIVKERIHIGDAKETKE